MIFISFFPSEKKTPLEFCTNEELFLTLKKPNLFLLSRTVYYIRLICLTMVFAQFIIAVFSISLAVQIIYQDKQQTRVLDDTTTLSEILPPGYSFYEVGTANTLRLAWGILARHAMVLKESTIDCISSLRIKYRMTVWRAPTKSQTNTNTEMFGYFERLPDIRVFGILVFMSLTLAFTLLICGKTIHLLPLAIGLIFTTLYTLWSPRLMVPFILDLTLLLHIILCFVLAVRSISVFTTLVLPVLLLRPLISILSFLSLLVFLKRY